MNQEVQYTVMENKILKENNFDKIVEEASKDIGNLNLKICEKEKENNFLAEKLKKLIELKLEMDEKKVKKKNNKKH